MVNFDKNVRIFSATIEQSLFGKGNLYSGRRVKACGQINKERRDEFTRDGC